MKRVIKVKASDPRELKDICFALRKKLHLSQRELAYLIGSTQTEISFIERGFIPVSSEKIHRIYQLSEGGK